MAQFLGFGDGSDGAVTLSGTDAPIDSACTGTAAATSLSATNASFATGQIILIHQTLGTGYGTWEINRIASYVAGTITLVYPLANTYNAGAQVLVMKQYTNVTGSLTVKAWNGTVGGIAAFLSNSAVTIDGTVQGTSKGFTGGATTNTTGSTGYAGAGPTGDSHPQQQAKNGAGGGGGVNLTPDGSAGGGGNVTAGGVGGGGGGGAGDATSSSDLVTANLGAGGGGSWADPSNGSGGTGGAFIVIMAKEKITITGFITNNGGAGGATGAEQTGCGGGAGGCVLLKSKSVVLGTNLVTATGGVGGTGTSNSGGNGGAGGIRIEACTVTGTTNPTYSDGVGGYSFCAGNSAIL